MSGVTGGHRAGGSPCQELSRPVGPAVDVVRVPMTRSPPALRCCGCMAQSSQILAQAPVIPAVWPLSGRLTPGRLRIPRKTRPAGVPPGDGTGPPPASPVGDRTMPSARRIPTICMLVPFLFVGSAAAQQEESGYDYDLFIQPQGSSPAPRSSSRPTSGSASRTAARNDGSRTRSSACCASGVATSWWTRWKTQT